MEDEFFEEEDSIFGDDDIGDCIILDELYEENKKSKASGCLTSFVIWPISLAAIVYVLMVALRT